MKNNHFYSLWITILTFFLLIGNWNTLYAQEMPITTQSEEARELFLEGRILFDNLRFDEAAQKFDQALQADQTFALANTYRTLSSTTDADFTRYLSNAVSNKSEVSNGERLLIESVKARSENEPMKAISILEMAVEQYPQDKRLHHFLGLNYQGANKMEKAEMQYEQAIALDANFAPPYNNLGYLYRDAEQYDKAETAFRNYIRILPEEANPHDSIGDLYTKMGKHDLAIEHYQKALDLNPNFYYSQQKIGDNLIFKGRFADGRIAYEQAIAKAPSSSEKISLHQSLAGTYIYEDNFDKALEENMTAIKWAQKESLPEDAASLYQIRALMNLEQGDIEAAEASLNACDEIISNNNLTDSRRKYIEFNTYRNKAIKYAKLGNFEKAMEKAGKMRQRSDESMNPNDMEKYYQTTGIIYFEKGEYAKAIEELKKSSKSSPYSLFYLAKSHEKLGNTEKAQVLFKKVANWNENSIEYAIVRSKARTSAGIGIASEIEE